MRKISESEKERILKLHRSIPLKSYLPKNISEQLLPSPKSTGGPTFNNQTRADEFRIWVHKNFPNVAKVNNLDPAPSPYYQSKEIEKVLDYVDPKTNRSLESLWLSSQTTSNKSQQTKSDILPLPKYQDRINPNVPPQDVYNQWGYDNETGIISNLFTGERFTKSFDDKLIPYTGPEKIKRSEMSAKYGKSYGQKEYSPEEFKQLMKKQENLDRIINRHPAHKIDYLKWDEMDSGQKHAFLMLASIGALFIPVIGWLAAAGIEATDALLYLEENRNYEASNSLLLTIIGSLPFVNRLKILGRFGDNVLASTAKKLGIGGTKNLTKEELELMLHLAKTLKTKEGIENLWSARKIFKSAQAFNDFKKSVNNLALSAGVTYYISGAPNNPLYNFIGSSSYEILQKRNVPEKEIEEYKSQFRWETPSDDHLMAKALEDNSATLLGRWGINKPVPLKYQTNKYKQEIGIITSGLERLGMTEPENDGRFFGTFGRPLVDSEGNQFKFIGGKFYRFDNDEDDWMEVKNVTEITKLEKLFKDNGLVKDKSGHIYLK